jgi:hypothetical protein
MHHAGEDDVALLTAAARLGLLTSGMPKAMGDTGQP